MKKKTLEGFELYRLLKANAEREHKEFVQELKAFLKKSESSMDASEFMKASIFSFLERMSLKFGQFSINQLAKLSGFTKKVANNIYKSNVNEFEKSISTIQNVFENEKENKALLEVYVGENVRLIKGVNEGNFNKIRSIAMGLAEGRKQSLVIRELNEVLKKTTSGYKRIARDQSSKLYSSITEVRAQSNGWEFYRWQDSNDGKVRDLSNSGGYQDHKNLDGKIFRFSEPPVDTFKGKGTKTHNPGFNYNCRCTAEILFDPPSFFNKNGDGSYSYKDNIKNKAA